MKRLIAAASLAFVALGAGGAPLTDTAKQLVSSLSAYASDVPTIESANRKGSKRVGGSNSKGKGSKYRGGHRK